MVTRCLRKRREDRYADARDLAVDLKSVQREVESGATQALPLKERVLGAFRAARELTPRRWIWIAAAVVGVGMLGALVSENRREWPGFFFPLLIGLVAYRRLRHRNPRLMRKLAAKIRKIPEVKLVVYSGTRATVVVDNALAKTYLRINAALDAVNGRTFFGEPLTVTIREEVPAAEIRSLLTGSGVLYVRDDVLAPGPSRR